MSKDRKIWKRFISALKSLWVAFLISVGPLLIGFGLYDGWFTRVFELMQEGFSELRDIPILDSTRVLFLIYWSYWTRRRFHLEVRKLKVSERRTDVQEYQTELSKRQTAALEDLATEAKKQTKIMERQAKRADQLATTLEQAFKQLAAIFKQVFAQPTGVTDRVIMKSDTASHSEHFERCKTMLGDNDILNRIDAIRCLGMLAQGYPEAYHIKVMILLCDFIRNPPILEGMQPSDSHGNSEGSGQGRPYDVSELRPDVQEALTVIGRRSQTQREVEREADYELDLHGADLKGGVLFDGHLERADLHGACLDETNLSGCHFDGADLRGASVDGAILPKDWSEHQPKALPNSSKQRR